MAASHDAGGAVKICRGGAAVRRTACGRSGRDGRRRSRSARTRSRGTRGRTGISSASCSPCRCSTWARRPLRRRRRNPSSWSCNRELLRRQNRTRLYRALGLCERGSGGARGARAARDARSRGRERGIRTAEVSGSAARRRDLDDALSPGHASRARRSSPSCDSAARRPPSAPPHVLCYL